jgi:Mg-chelatase subunit ChlD/type II secretory pathway pseudopilin PulG
MNTDLPPMKREDLEAKVTALLLGELPAEEAALLRELIVRDTGLARWHDRLKLTLELLRETAAADAAAPAPSAPLKLSPARREKLLAHFKTVAPKEFAPPPRRTISSLAALLAVVAVVAILASMLLPATSRAKMRAQRPAIINNLRLLDSAKQQWALEQRKSATDVPTMQDLQAYLGRGEHGDVPAVAGETYNLGAVAQQPVAQLETKGGKKMVTLPDAEGNLASVSQPAPAPAARSRRLERFARSAAPPPQAAPSPNQIVLPAPAAEDSQLSPPTAPFGVQPSGGPSVALLSPQTLTNATSSLASDTGTAADVALRMQNAKLLFEMGKYDDAAVILKQVSKDDPSNRTAAYYLDLNKEAGYADSARRKEELSDEKQSKEVAATGSSAPPPMILRDLGLKDLNEIAARLAPTNVYSLNVVGYIDTSKDTNSVVIAGTPITVATPALGDVPGLGNLFRNPAGLFPGGGGGGFGGAAGASGADASISGATIGRPGNGQAGAVNFYADKEAGQVFVVADGQTTKDVRQVVSNLNTTGTRSVPSDVSYEAKHRANQELEKASPLSAATLEVASRDTGLSRPAVPPPAGELRAKLAESEAIKPEVINMKYAAAADIATALNSLGASGGASVGGSTSGATAAGGRSTFQQNVNRVVQDAASAGQFRVFGRTKIIADERSNSLLVFASDDDKKKVDEIINKLDVAPSQPAVPPPVPQPEVLTSTNIFSTFSLNVSDASFKLAAASLQNGVMPEAAGIRSEEFINAFDYRDPEPAAGAPIGFAWERAAYPFAHHRDLLRFSVKTAALGRQNGRPLNLVLLLDKSGSMERADRVEIIRQALRVLAGQLQAQDTLSVVVFARTARLWVDGVPGSQAGEVANGLDGLAPEGGTNLEEAMRLAYATALRHYKAGGENRVVLLTDGAANLGDVDPESLKQKVEANHRQGIALDCFGVGWDGYNDTLMETLSRTGNGRYGFINTPEEAATEFAGKLAGALRVAASDVKVQVEFNPNRVTAWRQIGYAKHQLTKEQFRDNTVAAAQIGAAESGNALYTVEVNPAGDGPLCTVRVRFRLPGTSDYQEHAWDVPYTGTAVALDNASPAMRLAATAAAFSEWLASSPYAGEVTPDRLLAYLRGVPEIYGADARPKNLEWMIRQAKSIAGK